MNNNTEEITWINRKVHPIPNIAVEIYIKHKDGVYLCDWKRYQEEDYSHLHKDYWPAEGYLGTAEVIEGPHKGIGFHAWEQNDSEFVEYSITAICPIEIVPHD